MENGKLKIGIIGCGGIANGKHLPALSKQKDRVELVAFCDIILERAEKAKEEYGTRDAKVYEDYKELLKDPAIDVVHVLTPNVAHAQITIDAFAAGKHVMCEKPMAASVADARRMMEAWKASGKKFTVGYQSRFRPEVQNLKKSCEDGDLGEVYYAQAHAIRRRAVPTWGVFPNKALQGGGPLIDIGTHALDMTLWCMDNYEPARVTGSVFYKLGNDPEATQGNLWGPWDPETYEVEDSAIGQIVMKNGATIQLVASWALNTIINREASTTLCGTKAGADIYDGQVVYNRGKNGQLMEEKVSTSGSVAFYDGTSGKPEDIESRQWIDAILNDTDPCVRPEQAFVVTQILEAIYESARTGKEVVFE